MEIKILKSGRYLNTKLRAIFCEAGFILVTKDWYGKELIEQDKAKLIPKVPVPQPKIKKVSAKKMPAEKAPKSRKKSVENPFLE